MLRAPHEPKHLHKARKEAEGLLFQAPHLILLVLYVLKFGLVVRYTYIISMLLVEM